MNMGTTSWIKHATTAALTLLLLLSTPVAEAQKLQQNILDEATEKFDYSKVVAIYESRRTKGTATPDDLRQLAQTYQKLEKHAEAESIYTELMATGKELPKDMLAYAHQLRANGKYTEANEWYGNYAALNPDDRTVDAYTKDPHLLSKLMSDSTTNSVRKVPINSPQADLGMSVMGELLLFSSARGEGAGGKRTYGWDDQPYLNLYTALLKGETAEDPIVMRKDINSRYHDGTVSYDSTHKRMYFTRDNVHYGSVGKSDDGYLNLGIYFVDVVTGEFGQQEWDALIPFDHNDKNANYGHPCVSPDGAQIFFVSDRPGGQGGTDIWVSQNQGDQWGAPVNMGPLVNTAGNEMYPFLTGDSTLFFASTGQPGLGGLDIFSTRLTPAGPLRLRNLGYPINTRYNDHSLILINDTAGFFASDRPGGEGSDDIYGCTVRPETMIIAGIAIDKDSREPIDGADLVLKNTNGDTVVIREIELEDGGKFRIKADYLEQYILSVSRNGYLPVDLPINTTTDDIANLIVELEKYEFAVEGVITSAETGEAIPGATVVLTDGNDEHIKTETTDAAGKYYFTLKPESDYRIRVGKEGYFKQSGALSTKGKSSQVFKKDFALVKLAVNAVIRLDNIFYDLAKWNIRPDAAIELDKLVETLKENPTVKIELSAHTDCRGKDAYNLSLSEKRAKSAVDYILKKGIPKESITSKGYGETMPSENCDCTKCTEDEHQRNRRTEFKVLSL
ncbi:MAG: carboxypeptidase regulatory-like domain-containing protein [Flavobacteriales bacterium]|nr:carboxypeptidase regulatory-like domain-containing protein [Flavobacteriales bacterium]